MMWLSILISSAAAASFALKESPIELDATALKTGRLGGVDSASGYVSLDLAYEPFARVRVALEARTGLKLVNRGDAHLTLVTPPEFEKLRVVLSPAEIRKVIGADLKFEDLDLKPVCIGQGSVDADQTWFVVMESKSADRARRALASEFIKKGGSAADFSASEFYPHVTLGFLKRDLHLQDGVFKDASSCRFPMGHSHRSERH